MRKVAILAAGTGKRLQPLTSGLPKALLPVGDMSLFGLQMRSLAENGVAPGEVLVITGHEHLKLAEAAECLGADVLFNADYENSNNVVSVSCLAQAFQDDGLSELVIVNCDVLAHPEIFQRLLQPSAESGVMVDSGRTPGEEAMKVDVRDGRIWRFSKTLEGPHVRGEYIGLARLNGKAIAELFCIVREMVKDGEVGHWYEEAFNRIAARVPLFALSTGSLPWIEIDTLEDYESAQQMCREVLA
jgi:choline kinase